MKAVICGKAGSSRVKLKNYRPFYNELSLTDILLSKLVRIMDKRDIFLSCELIEYQSVAKTWGINFVHRNEKYTLQTTNNVDVVKGICDDIPGDDDILFCSCVEPLFDEYSKIFEIWDKLDKEEFDSLNVVYPHKHFYLDQNFNPIGFGFGYWHKYSQDLQPLYRMSWATEILKRESINKISYMVGAKPYWYESYSPVVDIDTEDDWKLAQVMYNFYCDKG